VSGTGEPLQPGHDQELWDLQNLRAAARLCDWMFEQYAPYVHGEVVEIGAGIGTFSQRLAARADVHGLLLLEPEQAFARPLADTFAADERVHVAAETLPDSPALSERTDSVDFVLCQNVLEHIEDDASAVRAMAGALRAGGHLTLLVPAHPRLYTKLDRDYGHFRRYTRARLRGVLADADLQLEQLYSFNLLGVPGWWLNGMRNSPRLDGSALRAYDLLVPFWSSLERRRRPPWGLSLIAHARKPR
jgi:SAM-dependent methyltransferase